MEDQMSSDINQYTHRADESQAVFIAETVAWLDLLYGKCTQADGTLIAVNGDPVRRFAGYSIGAPTDLVEAARHLHYKPGLFLKVNLYDWDRVSSRSRGATGRLSDVQTVVAFALDCDANKEGYAGREVMLAALSDMPKQPTLIVNSDGEAGGFHAYWIFKEPIRLIDDQHRPQVSTLATRWQERLRELAGDDLDSTADLARMLRVVGSLRASGRRVTTHSYDPSREYTLEDLSLPATAAERHRVEHSAVNLRTADSRDHPIDKFIQQTGVTVEQLLTEMGYESLGKDEWRRPGSGSGQRSLKVATLLDGINMFSGGDDNFEAIGVDGRTGRFYSTAAVFVIARFKGNWGAAAAFCKKEFGKQFLKRKA
jgi:hypothetical protein